MSKNVHGRVIVITGVSSGVGGAWHACYRRKAQHLCLVHDA
jgi:NADP-dependent 3-hydroxy acid dehydrogenase YdfG